MTSRPPSDFRVIMCTLKYYCYVKIMVTSSDFALYHEIFDISSVLSLKFTCCMDFVFNKGEVIDVLTWPPDNVHIMKNVRTENLPLCEIYINTKWYQQSIIFCIRCKCSLSVPQPSTQAFSCFVNSSAACASFSLSIKSSAEVTSAFFYLFKLLFWSLTEKC